jgi:hypothetical protein
MRVSRISSAHALAAVSSWSDEQRRNFYQEHSGRDLSPSSLEASIASSVSKSTRKRSAGASGKRPEGVAWCWLAGMRLAGCGFAAAAWSILLGAAS